ncbi:MAG: tetratricopeptide repeat protein [Elusimicrobiota bacterium]
MKGKLEKDDEKIRARGIYLLFDFYDSKPKNEKNIEESIRFGERIKENFRDYPFYEDVLFKLGNIYFFNNFKFEKAKNTYKQLINDKPDTKWKNICRVRIDLIENNISEKEALRLYVTAENFFEDAKFKKAAEYLKKIINNFDDIELKAHAYYFLGDIYYYKLENFEEAKKNYIPVYEKFSVDPISRNAIYKVGEINRKNKDWKQTIEVYNKFTEMYPDAPVVEDAYYFIGESYLNLGQLKAAKNSFNLILGDFPDSKWTDVIYHKIKDINKRLKND